MKTKLDLQYFADLNTNITSDSGMSAEQKEYYDGELLRRAKPNLVHAQFGKKAPLPQGNGKNVRWRRMKSYGPALTPLQEGITPKGKKAVFESIEVTAEQYGDYTAVSDRLKMESTDPIILELTREHGIQSAETIDTVTRNELQTGTSVIFAPKSTGAVVSTRADLDKTCKLTPKVISMAKTVLKRRTVPTINGSYIAIIHPDIEHDVTTNDDFIDVVKYNNQEKIFEGEIGKLYGVRFASTPNAKIWNNSSASQGATPAGLAVYGCLFFGEDAYGVVQLEGGNMEMIVKQLGSGGTEDPLNQRATVGWKVTDYATKILDETRIVRVECCSEDFSPIAEAN